MRMIFSRLSDRIPLFAGMIVLALTVAGAPANAGPAPPCQTKTAVEPAYGAANGAPGVQVWTQTALKLGAACPQALNGQAQLVVALSGRFTHRGTVQDLAARIGKVSALRGVRYWSTTEHQWRVLIEDSFAVSDPASAQKRPDFTAQEVLSGKTLIMSQRDTRSTGQNLYAMRTTSQSTGQMTVMIENLTSIRFLLVTLFNRQDLITAHFFTHLGGHEWGYYGLTVVRRGSVSGKENSFINRAAAFQRFITGQKTDKEPPVAR